MLFKFLPFNGLSSFFPLPCGLFWTYLPVVVVPFLPVFAWSFPLFLSSLIFLLSFWSFWSFAFPPFWSFAFPPFKSLLSLFGYLLSFWFAFFKFLGSLFSYFISFPKFLGSFVSLVPLGTSFELGLLSFFVAYFVFLFSYFLSLLLSTGLTFFLSSFASDFDGWLFLGYYFGGWLFLIY